MHFTLLGVVFCLDFGPFFFISYSFVRCFSPFFLFIHLFKLGVTKFSGMFANIKVCWALPPQGLSHCLFLILS